MTDFLNFSGKTVAVTGSSGLIGTAIQHKLLAAGAKVIALDIAFADKAPANCTAVEFDISDIDGLKPNVEALYGKYEISAWINTAFPRKNGWRNAPEEMQPSHWRDNVDAQLNSYCYSSMLVAECMKAKKIGGSIVNLSSIFASVAHFPKLYENTGHFPAIPYTAIKGGVEAFARTLAARYGQYGIRVNTVSPGAVDSQSINREFANNYSRHTCLERLAKPEEVANVVLFVASDAASYVTGTNITVDGGYTTI